MAAQDGVDMTLEVDQGPLEAPERRISERTALVVGCSLLLALGLLVGSAIALNPRGEASGPVRSEADAEQLSVGGGAQVEGAGEVDDAPTTGGGTAPSNGKAGSSGGVRRATTTTTAASTPGSIAPFTPPRAIAEGTTTSQPAGVAPIPSSTATTRLGAPRGSTTTTTRASTTTSPTTAPPTTTPPPTTRTVVEQRKERIKAAPGNSEYRQYSFGSVVPGPISISVSFTGNGTRKVSTRIYVGTTSDYANLLASCPAGPTSPQACTAEATSAATSYTFLLQGEDLEGQAVDIDVSMRYDVAA